MALSPTITIDGGGAFSGISTNVATYSATEDATPLRVDSNSGGTGQVNFSVVASRRTATTGATTDLVDSTILLSDGSNGDIGAVVDSLGTDDGVTAVNANSRMSSLLATRTAVAMQGTPEEILRYYLSLGGITDFIVFEGTGSTSSRAVPGWTGVVWDYIRAFASVVSAEVALVSNNVIIRPLHTRVSVNRRDSSVSTTHGKGDMAQSVEVKYYSNTYKTGLVYPEGGWNEDVQVYQVDAGETFTTNIPVNVSPTDLVQPTCLDYVAKNVNNQSVYSVVGNDGLAIPAAQWTANGGSVTVAIGEDNRSIDVTIVGARTLYSPYRIGVGAGASDVYSSLRIMGTGTFFNEQSITIQTGLTPDDTPQVVGTTVENPFIDTLSRAWGHGLRVAQGYAGFANTISKKSGGINRLDVSGDRSFPTFTQFNEGFTAKGGTAPSWQGKTLADFDASWANKSFSAFDNYYINLVKSNYSNQAFGNVAGSRVLHDDAYYRIDSATITETEVSYDGTADTLFGDFDRRWSAASYTDEMKLEYGQQRASMNPKTTFTFDDFNAMMAGRTFRNFNYAPLWRIES